MTTIPCPLRSVSSCHDFNGIKLTIGIRRKHAINLSLVNTFPRSRVPRRLLFCYNSPICSRGSGWSRWMRGGHFQGEDESPKTAVVDVHAGFSLSQPKSLADGASRLAPRWFQLLKRVQPWLPLLLQNDGVENRDGDFHSRLGYGGGGDDDDSDKRKKKLLIVYQWWSLGVASASLVVWAMGAYSGVPQRTQASISQFVDCVLWLALMWCVAAVCLWTARMVVSLTPSGSRNGWNCLGREFVLTSKFDEWMAQNVVAVPGLVISLFLVCDLIHYGKNLNLLLVSRAESDESRILKLLNSRRVGGAPPRGGSLLSRVVKWRRGTKRRRS